MVHIWYIHGTYYGRGSACGDCDEAQERRVCADVLCTVCVCTLDVPCSSPRTRRQRSAGPGRCCCSWPFNEQYSSPLFRPPLRLRAEAALAVSKYRPKYCTPYAVSRTPYPVPRRYSHPDGRRKASQTLPAPARSSATWESVPGASRLGLHTVCGRARKPRLSPPAPALCMQGHQAFSARVRGRESRVVDVQYVRQLLCENSVLHVLQDSLRIQLLGDGNNGNTPCFVRRKCCKCRRQF